MARIAIGDDEKKKLTILGGLLAAIAVVVVVLYVVPNMGGGTNSDDAVPATPSTPATPAGAPSTDGAGAPGAGGGAPAGGSGGAAPGGITAASLVSVERYRSDPFAPFVLPPLPTPVPTPAPPPAVVIPPPVEIVPPDQIGDTGVSLPPMGVNSSGARPLAALPPIVPRRVATAPTAPRFFAPSGGQGSGVGIIRSQNKRLSGVIIGDSVRALLEISNGETVTTRVVQPGDEVDGIRILRLERVNEAGRTITRLVVRENNQEQYVELRAAPQQAAGDGGLGIGGPPGAFPGGPPGAFPGGPR